MKRMLLLGLILATTQAMAETSIVLNPGNGRDYLLYWCGGQSVQEYADGFDTAGNAVTTVIVSASCNGSGRASRNHYYKTCSRVTFDTVGNRLTVDKIGSVSWVQGQPAPSCGADADPSIVDHFGGLTLSTGTVFTGVQGSAYANRAILTIP